jgi:predicted GIY-YIG superfamily endonuclease
VTSLRSGNAPDQDRTALYRLYSDAGQLLYVGISSDPDVRFRKHSYWQIWWHHVARAEIEWLWTREAASAAEDEAIKFERPLYNSTYHLGGEWRTRPTAWYDATSDIADLTVRLQAAIRDGQIKAGEKLLARQLGPQFGYSSSIADSAMSGIVSSGLLKRHKGGYLIAAFEHGDQIALSA